MVLAPEHPLVRKLTTPEHEERVLAYVERASHMTELDRQADRAAHACQPAGRNRPARTCRPGTAARRHRRRGCHPA